MTRERCKELLPIMQAFADGKRIQFKSKFSDVWVESDFEPRWLDDSDYRIKPTEEYRPYKDCEEMIQDFYKKYLISETDYDLPLIWVRTKDTSTQNLITAFNNTVGGSCVFVQDIWKSLADLFDDYEYLDGSKIGVRV